ncbi:ClpP/crotonase [Aspergillus heteromorphus CBS 117.55]|uniref:ClpP/crotonase n=1 Tax=Aspergillus heteromorphus CBS 117.55 TaxID=1448321 RepID=A0A317VLA4_9EURO|nr:ClpP/crotonase [Aspergillus heteromorphus CBS 117.55]PWY73652.1 ClpP/crotonase [Aspergillus heteromorphus CBS 117.55]
MPTTSPPPTQFATLSFPTPQILLVTLCRPAALNSINSAGHHELHAVWTWMDKEPSIRVGVLTGQGRAFCAGADLKGALHTYPENGTPPNPPPPKPNPIPPPTGFGGLSRRSGKKPIICAVNGLCLGGGCEMILNADVVIASRTAFFGLPEVQRGVVAWAGALPRLVRTVGRQRAMEMALTGRRVDAVEAERWGFVNEVVGDDYPGQSQSQSQFHATATTTTTGSGTGGAVVRRAVEVAGMIAANSPDSVVVSREGVKLGWELGAEEASRVLVEEWGVKVGEGENVKEGLRAFVEKRKPRWVDSKL